MSTPLGPGVRVYIGYLPDDCALPSGRRARCTVGTIIGGPWLPGSMMVPCLDGVGRINSLTFWYVQPDGQSPVYADEGLLHPIDDGDEHGSTDVQQDEELTA